MAGAAGLLAACTSIPADQGRSVSDSLRQSHSTVTAGKDAGSLLREPLDADGCVQMALLSSPRLQKLYAELGVAQADVYAATRIANPSLSYAELRHSGAVKKTLGLSQRITELLFLRASTRVAKSVLLQTQQRIAAAVLEQEAEVRKAYYDYVAASLADQMRQRIAAVASASAQYAGELHVAGNLNELELSRVQAAASEARVLQLQPRSPQARAALMKLLGVAGEARFVEQLALPAAPAAIDAAALQSFAAQQRLDLAATREELQSAEAQLRLTRRWRWVGDVEVGVEREREFDGAVSKGLTAGVELPVFNQGGDRKLRAASRVVALTADVRTLELDIQQDVAAQAALLAAAAAAVDEYRQRLMPLQARLVALSREQQNFMLSGVFEVLQARQQQFVTWQAYLQAVADYWKVRAELARVSGGRLPDGVAPAAAQAVAELPTDGE